MTKVTIFGAGSVYLPRYNKSHTDVSRSITGLSVASRLSKDYDVTIVARDLPGDEPSQQWASPWACAGWVALGGTPLEEKMQLDSLAYFTKLASSHPDSSVRVSQLTDLHDVGVTTAEELWSKDRVPGFEVLDVSQLPESFKTVVAVKYPSFVVTPPVFLPWLRRRLEASGVKFQRISTVHSLDELQDLGHDILVNASGIASRDLADVLDEKVLTDRTYTTLVKSDYDQSFVRRTATEYTYIFGRGDGTAVLGGITEPVDNEPLSKEASRADVSIEERI